LARVIPLKVRILSGERVIAIYEKVAFGLENEPRLCGHAPDDRRIDPVKIVACCFP
jgi:hypothetical protein